MLPRSYLCHLRWWLCHILIVSLKLTRRACALTAWVPIISATAPMSGAMARIGILATPQGATLKPDILCMTNRFSRPQHRNRGAVTRIRSSYLR